MNKLIYIASILVCTFYYSSLIQAKNTMQLVNYFEIPVADMTSAKTFYEQVFGYSLTLHEIDGNEMALFPDASPGASPGAAPGIITGALAKGDSYVPGKQGARLYFKVTDIDSVLQKVKSAGGELNYAKTDIGELGFVAEFMDSEGNIIALHEDKSE